MLSINLSVELKHVHDIRVTVFPLQVIKYNLHLKLTTSDLFTNDNLNQYPDLGFT
jgi:hypothetical protein